jgi:hypothetical protein
MLDTGFDYSLMNCNGLTDEIWAPSWAANVDVQTALQQRQLLVTCGCIAGRVLGQHVHEDVLVEVLWVDERVGGGEREHVVTNRANDEAE